MLTFLINETAVNILILATTVKQEQQKNNNRKRQQQSICIGLCVLWEVLCMWGVYIPKCYLQSLNQS